MLTSVIQKLTPHYQSLRGRTVLMILTAVSLFVRLPFFFRDYIDRDESTFILMGQSWVDGHLPYTELWDLKPPVTFAFFTLLIYLFGKSFVVIRLIGAIMVAVTALYSYKIGLQTTTKKVSFWAALACVGLLSMFGSLQGVMSEHLSMFFFMPALYVIIARKSTTSYVLAGLLIGLALMTKLNLAYVAVALFCFILLNDFKKNVLWQTLGKSVLFGLGILSIITITILPYYQLGMVSIWWQSVVLASLKYAGSSKDSILQFLPMALFFSIFFYFAYQKKLLNFKDKTIQILSLVAIAVVFSFLKGGRLNGHYLIQLHPVFVILVGVFISSLTFIKRIKFKPILVFLLLLLPAESYLEYFNIVKNKIERGTFYNGEGFTVPQYITKNNISTKNILFLEYHIGYWMLDTKPPTKASTHPSNICRSEIFPYLNSDRTTNLEELKHIMEVIQPQTVVVRKNRSVFDKLLLEENEYIKTYLAKHYAAPITVDQAEILTRL